MKIVYDTLGKLKAEDYLHQFADELRTEAAIVRYEPEGDTTICLNNSFDIPNFIIQVGDEYVDTIYTSAQRIENDLKTVSKTYFGSYILRPYEEWLDIMKRERDEDKTRREYKKLLANCQVRSLSVAFKNELKAAVLAI